MTVRRFWDDPYLARLETRVATVDGTDVTLVETIFFAFSGGQESDHGTIAGRPVREARKAGDTILYTLDPDHGLVPGDTVAVAIDRERRYRLMRLHFAAELVLELVQRQLGPLHKSGAHIAADKARIDFVFDGSIAPHLPALCAAAQALVDADLPIASAFSDRAAGRRYWEVDGFARVPCGGTHLRRTGEVGTLSLRRRNPGQGRERIEVRVSP